MYMNERTRASHREKYVCEGVHSIMDENLMIKIYEKYKSKVAFPRDFVHSMRRYKDPTVSVSLSVCGYRTSRRVQERCYHKLGHSFLTVIDGEDISKSLQTGGGRH